MTSSCGTKIYILPACLPLQDIDTSLVKVLAEERSPSLIPYITNHDLYLAFDDTKEALDKHAVREEIIFFYSNLETN